MPNIKSQEKRDRQNIKRELKNKSLRSKIKTNRKKLATDFEQGDAQVLQEDLRIYFKKLDKAVKKGAVHKNFAANKKAKAAKLVNSAAKEEK
ncbi:MAG: 30S ribosomal protein S20 [Actinomycetota bacterium]|jgi:small subunit ribosomal protein S20|nr:30S ribosomal protein S20 [Actinomycetota bacterium]